MTEDEYLTPEEVAKLLKVSPRTVWRRIEDGTIPAVKLGRLVRIRRADLERALGAPATSRPRRRPSRPK